MTTTENAAQELIDFIANAKKVTIGLILRH